LEPGTNTNRGLLNDSYHTFAKSVWAAFDVLAAQKLSLCNSAKSNNFVTKKTTYDYSMMAMATVNDYLQHPKDSYL
jgi:hypothetical protein